MKIISDNYFIFSAISLGLLWPQSTSSQESALKKHVCVLKPDLYGYSYKHIADRNRNYNNKTICKIDTPVLVNDLIEFETLRQIENNNSTVPASYILVRKKPIFYFNTKFLELDRKPTEVDKDSDLLIRKATSACLKSNISSHPYHYIDRRVMYHFSSSPEQFPLNLQESKFDPTKYSSERAFLYDESYISPERSFGECMTTKLKISSSDFFWQLGIGSFIVEVDTF